MLRMAEDLDKLAAQAQRIKQLRLEKATDDGRRVTQDVVATHVGVTLRAYQEWEGGRGDIRPENLQALAEYFGVTRDFIEYGVMQRDRRQDDTPDLAAVLTPTAQEIVERLERVEGKLDQLVAPPTTPVAAPNIEAATVEELVDYARALLLTIEQINGKLGPLLGRRDVRARSVRDQARKSPSTAA